MTNEQFDFLNADLIATKLLLICLAKSYPRPSALHDIFAAERAFHHTAFANSELSETADNLRERQCDELEKSDWGHVAVQVVF